MKRVFSAFSAVLVALGVALTVAACSDHERFDESQSRADCSRFTSCGACTPVLGCGWCSTSSGSGICTDQPNDCASAQQFSWTWEPSGCRAGADASVVGVDSGKLVDASTAPVDSGTAVDASTVNDSGSAVDATADAEAGVR